VEPRHLALEGVPAAAQGSGLVVAANDSAMPGADGAQGQTLREATEEFQRQWLRASLARNNAHISNAAREAGMDKSNFHRLLRRLGVRAGEGGA